VSIVLKSESLILLELSGPVRASSWIALPLPLPSHSPLPLLGGINKYHPISITLEQQSLEIVSNPPGKPEGKEGAAIFSKEQY
jgi:hypothetical protein